VTLTGKESVAMSIFPKGILLATDGSKEAELVAKGTPLRGGKILVLMIMLVVLAGMLLTATPALPASENPVPPIGSFLSAEADEDGVLDSLLFCALVFFSIPPVRWGLLPAPCELPMLCSVYGSGLERPG
jgi:hypothetical protein